MKSYRAAFKKVSGELRKMHFIKLPDLPRSFLREQLNGASDQHNLGNGLELVWDLENGGFRIFNWKTVEGVVKEEEVNFVL